MIKEFFGPTWTTAVLKIIVGIFLFMAVTFFHSMLWGLVDYWANGWPLHFYESWGPCHDSEATCSSFNTLFLILDVLIWYGVVCLGDLIRRRYS